MSASVAQPAAAAAAAAGVGVAPAGWRSKKKLLIIVAAAVLLLAVAGAGGAWYLKSKAAREAAEAEAADDDGGGEKATAGAGADHGAAKKDHKHAPTFLALEPFIVNLADKEADRFAQIGITLEVDTAVFADEMKTYMPAIRNQILMILAHKTSRELLEREGKERLAAEIVRESVRPMGIEMPAPTSIVDGASAVATAGGDDEAGEPGEARRKSREKDKEQDRGKARAKAKKPEHNPVQRVLFSSFIIQ